ncbi:hypothetical protein H8356DRAFT_1327210 [Neocallimastix lanati (nom. inval.)]|nr:hypothetical protein H8356DRAFT_1327210 [Neocallimastix sp. JGI-2020a]
MSVVLPSLDPYKIGYVDPARIKIAIVPVGKIKKKLFKKFIEIISEKEILDLKDIPFILQENGVVNNKKPEEGKVLLKYVTSHNVEHGRYEDIQPFRRIFGVIGIIDCEQQQDIQKEYQKFKKLISKKFSTILSRVCFAHNPSEEQKSELLSIEPVQFFTDDESFKAKYNEVLVQLISNIITRFDTLINDIKRLQIIHSPKPNNPTAKDQKDYVNNPIPTTMTMKKEPSNFPILPPSVYVSGTAREISQNSQTVETSSPTVLTNPSLQNVVGMLADSRARKLTASRSQKLASDLLLLAGRVSEAAKNYSNILETMKNNNDFLWQAVCMESYQCALFLEALQNNKSTTIKIQNKDNSTETEDLKFDTLTSYEHFRKTGLTIYHTNIKLKTLICELPERTREVIALYDKVSDKEDKPSYPFLAITSCLRIAKLLSIMHNIHLNSSFLSGASIQLNSNKRLSSPNINIDNNVNIVEPVNGVSKIAVASWLNKAWHGGLQFLSENLKIDICASISAIYGSVGMLRKHAFFLHQTDLMTVTYIRNLIQKNLTKNKDSSSSTSPISPRSNSFDVLNDDDDDESNRFIAYPSGELMERVCEIIGIGESLRTTPLLVPYKNDLVWEMRKDELKKKEALKWNNRQSSQENLGKPKFENLQFGWPELQIFMMKQCLEMSLISEDFQKTISFSGRLLRRLHSYLIPSRQKEIADLLCYVLQRRQIELLHQQKIESSKKQENQNHYSKLELSEAGFSIASSLIILDSIDISEYLPKRIPYPYHKYKNEETDDENNPFIYSPFILRKAKSNNMLNRSGVNEKMLMVANEPVEFIITFTNTYSFDIEIEGLTIKTSGIKVKSVPVSVIIPAFTRYYQVKVFATPLEAGTLRILGCKVKMFGGSIEEILIPPSSNIDKIEIEDDRDRLLGKSSLEYYKQYKIREIMLKEGKEVKDLPEPEKPWEKSFKVLDEQALLQVKEVSLGTQAAIMLFEGEISKFTIKLENIGTVPITYMKLTINEKYGEKRNSNMIYEFADVLYEKEIYEKGKKTFWLQQTINTGKEEINRDSNPTNKSDTEIIPINLMPNKQCEIVIGTYGNILCSSGSMCIKYGNVNFDEIDSDDESPYYYLRQIDMPIMITVQRGLTTLNADMLVFNGNSEADTLRNFRNRKKQITEEENKTGNKTLADQNDPYISNSLEELLEMVQFEQKINFNKYCLLTFELNNLWNIPFEIKFTIDEEKNSDCIEINVLIDANSTKRIFLPILRYNLPESILNQEIPTPNNQEIAYKVIKLVEHEEKIRKEQFWFKEDLFGGLILGKGKISATWNCSRIRNGILNLRTLKLTSSMLNILKVKDITFDVCLEPLKSTKENAIISSGQDGDEISCKLREMVGLKWTINNHLNVPKKVCIRIEPVQDFDNGLLDYHLQGRMAWSGSLQKVLEEIPPNSSIDYVLPVYFYSPGHFKFIYHCELVGNIKEHSKNGENIWWGDSPAIIHVV